MIGHYYPAGDLEVGTVIDGADYARQKIGQRLRFFLGEWFLDTSLGVPWFESILVKNPDLRFVQGILEDVIAAVPGITKVSAVEASLDTQTRHLTVAYRAVWQGATLVSDVLTENILP